jgi:hypothetical protein
MTFVIGRPRTPRMTTSDLLAVDIFKLHRAGGLVVGAVTRCHWPHPAAPLDVIVKAEHDAVTLSIAGAAEVSVRIEWELTTYFAGVRPWWACPRCLARRRFLHMQDGRVGCRGQQCFGLAYRSRCEFWSSSRALRRALALRRKLGAAVQPFGELPPRPRQHMAAKWYDRIVAEIRICEREAAGMLADMNGVLADWRGE